MTMSKNKIKLTIGEFSKINNISAKALRHYEKIGLLIPFERDNLSGYRYYVVEQIEQMSRIIYMKKLGFALEEIKEVFEKGQVKRLPLNNGKKTDYKKKANFLTKICIILSAVIVAMFIINMTSDNVNIINYRNEIINQYEDWEKELTEREEAVKILEDKYKK